MHDWHISASSFVTLFPLDDDDDDGRLIHVMCCGYFLSLFSPPRICPRGHVSLILSFSLLRGKERREREKERDHQFLRELSPLPPLAFAASLTPPAPPSATCMVSTHSQEKRILINTPSSPLLRRERTRGSCCCWLYPREMLPVPHTWQLYCGTETREL